MARRAKTVDQSGDASEVQQDTPETSPNQPSVSDEDRELAATRIRHSTGCGIKESFRRLGKLQPVAVLKLANSQRDLEQPAAKART